MSDNEIGIKVQGMDQITTLLENLTKLNTVVEKIPKASSKWDELSKSVNKVNSSVQGIASAITKTMSVAAGAATALGAKLLDVGSEYAAAGDQAKLIAKSPEEGAKGFDILSKSLANSGIEAKDAFKFLNAFLAAGQSGETSAELAKVASFMQKSVEGGSAAVGAMQDLATTGQLTASGIEALNKAGIKTENILSNLNWKGAMPKNPEELNKIIEDYNKNLGGTDRALRAIEKTKGFKAAGDAAMKSGSIVEKLKNATDGFFANATKGIDFEAIIAPLRLFFNDPANIAAFSEAIKSMASAFQSIPWDTILPVITKMIEWAPTIAIAAAGIWALSAAYGVWAAALGVYATAAGIAATTGMSLTLSLYSMAVAELAAMAPFLLVVAAIALVVGALYLLWDNWDSIVNAIVDIGDFLVDGIVAGFNWLVDFFKEWGGLILAIITGPIGLIIYFWDDIVKFFSGLVDTILNFFYDMVGAFFSMIGEWYDAGVNIIMGLIDGIFSGASKLYDSIKGIATGALEVFTNIFKQHSPSKEMDVIGRYNIMGLQQGQEDESKDLFKSSANIAGGTLDSFSDSADGSGGAGGIGGSSSKNSANVTININGGDINEVKEAIYDVFAQLNFQLG